MGGERAWHGSFNHSCKTLNALSLYASLLLTHTHTHTCANSPCDFLSTSHTHTSDTYFLWSHTVPTLFSGALAFRLLANVYLRAILQSEVLVVDDVHRRPYTFIQTWWKHPYLSHSRSWNGWRFWHLLLLTEWCDGCIHVNLTSVVLKQWSVCTCGLLK